MDINKIWDYIEVKDQESCWIWTKGKANYGYGVINTSERKQFRVHRLVWSFYFGDIPDGMFVLHKCDNPPCCNPGHLFIGTQADNIRDMIRKGRRGNAGVKPGTQTGEKNHNSKLTNDNVLDIRELLNSGESHSRIASMFGVSRPTITLINTGSTWNLDNMED